MTITRDPNDDIFVSVQLNSNRPDQIRGFLDSIETTASLPSSIEVLVHIDEGDHAMEDLLAAEAARRAVRLRQVKTGLVKDFFDLWKPLNVLLRLTAKSAYFVFNCSDECRFLTKGWDDVLRRYVGYYDDHIFRIRASRLRYRNYLDYWECGCAPDSLTFYTKRWMDIVGDWNPCMGPDSFQQCIAFYLNTSDPFNINEENRDIPEPFLRFSGEGASLGLQGEARRTRVRGQIKYSFVLWSHATQTEARRRAKLLLAHIWIARRKLTGVVVEDDKARQVVVARDPVSNKRLEWSYRLSRFAVFARNNYRKLRYNVYAGGGSEAAFGTFLEGMVFYLAYKSDHFARFEEWLRSKMALRGQRLLMDRRMRSQMAAIVAVLMGKDFHDYYIYGTGEYARRVCQYIADEGLPSPAALIEEQGLLEQRGNPSHSKGIPIVADRDVIPTLTPDQWIVIGSPIYYKEIADRLRQQDCRANVIDPTEWK